MKALLPVMFACVVAIVGCGEDSVVERPGENEIAPSETTAPALTTEADTEVEGMPEVDGTVMPIEPDIEDQTGSSPTPPLDTPSSNSPVSDPPASTKPANESAPPSEGQASLASRYTLATVDGRNLPVVTDSRPGCQIEVLSGHLAFATRDRFSISTATRETCDGRVTTEDVWEASGTVRMSGSALHFEGTSGENFGTADGVFNAGGITIRSFTHENGVEVVEWKFVKG